MPNIEKRFLLGAAVLMVLSWQCASCAQAKPRIAVLPARAVAGSPVKGIVSLSDKFLPVFTGELSNLLSHGDTYELIPAQEVDKLLTAQPTDSAQAAVPSQTIDDAFRNADGYAKLQCDAIVIPSLRFDRTGSFLKLIGTVVVAPPGKITYTWGNGIRPLNVLKVQALTAPESSEQAEQALVKSAAADLVNQINSVVSQVPEGKR